MAEKNGKRYRNFIFFLGNLKIEKRPENEREKRPAHEGPARGVHIHIRPEGPVEGKPRLIYDAIEDERS